MNYKTLLKRLEQLKEQTNKSKPSFKVLARLDPQFEELRRLGAGLKLSVALGAVKENRYCDLCSKYLAKVHVCLKCLKTKRGLSYSKDRRDAKFVETWSKRTSEQEKARREKTEKTTWAYYGVRVALQSEEVKSAIKRTLNRRYGVNNVSEIPTVVDKRQATSMRKRGVSCPLKDPEVKAKVTATLLKKYGVTNSMQIPSSQQKCRVSWRASFSEGHPLRNQDVLQRLKTTNLQRYGYAFVLSSPHIQSKIRSTVRKRYGVEYASQSDKVKKKTIQTNLKRYGAPHPLQNAKVFDSRKKSRYARKQVRILDQIHTVQGYEPQVLRYLESNGYLRWVVTDLKQMPEIWYTDDEDRKHRYYPDFVFESAITGKLYIAEVKAPYTLHSRNMELKARAAIQFCKQSSGLFHYALALWDNNQIQWVRSTKQFKSYAT